MYIQLVKTYIALTLLLPIGSTIMGQTSQSYLSDPKKVSELQFIENIELTQSDRPKQTLVASTPSKTNSPESISSDQINSGEPAIETLTPIQFKYAQILQIEVESAQSISLYRFIDQWWGTPYQYGGSTLNGIDCSAFSAKLEAELFQMNLPRTAKEQYDMCSRIDQEGVRQGDLVFFKTTRKSISHVGVYLANGYFVHASTSMGVMINHLDEEYYHKRFSGFGRFNPSTIHAQVETNGNDY